MIPFEYLDSHHFNSEFGPSESDRHYQTIKIGKLKRYTLLQMVEAVEAAKLNGSRLINPVLCLSGGLDSEAMALAFLNANVPFEAAIMAFTGGLNQYDVTHALDFCAEHKIPYQIIEMDAAAILRAGSHLAIAEKYR